MIRYEYKLQRVSMRMLPLDNLNALGKDGYEVVQGVLHNNDMVVLMMKTIETKSAPANKKEKEKKQASKKDQQEIKDVTPTTKHVEKVMDELKAEE